MHLITVGGPDRAQKAFVLANTLEDLISSAAEELHFPVNPDSSLSTQYVVYQESTGVKIGNDAILQHLAKNTAPSLEVLILPCGTAWRTATQATSAQDTPNAHGSSHSQTFENLSNEQTVPTTPLSRRPPLPMRPIVEILQPVLDTLDDPGSVTPPMFLRLKKAAIKEVYTEIFKFIRSKVKDATYSTARHYAKAVIEYQGGKFGRIFEVRVGSRFMNNGLGTFTLQLYNHLLYKMGKEKDAPAGRRRTRRIVDNSDPDDVEPIGSNKEAGDYGCVSYAPPIPELEDEASQEDKRQRLTTIETDSEEAAVLMEQTYATLRSELNRMKRPLATAISAVFARWPCLTSRKLLLSHANTLLGKNVVATWTTSLGERCGEFNDYMNFYFSTMDSRRSTALSRDMLALMKERQAAAVALRSQAVNSIAMFPLLAAFMKEDVQQLLQVMPATTSDQEMVEKVKAVTACPVAVLRGSSLFDENCRCSVVVSDNVIEANEAQDCVLLTFVSYYIFGFQYPTKIANSLEFIQRILLDINPEASGTQTGSKHEKKRRHVDGVGGKIKELSNKILHYTSDWGRFL